MIKHAIVGWKLFSTAWDMNRYMTDKKLTRDEYHAWPLRVDAELTQVVCDAEARPADDYSHKYVVQSVRVRVLRKKNGETALHVNDLTVTGLLFLWTTWRLDELIDAHAQLKEQFGLMRM